MTSNNDDLAKALRENLKLRRELATEVAKAKGEKLAAVRLLCFPKIICGGIGDVARPEREQRRSYQSVGWAVVTVHLSVKPDACAFDCKISHRRKEFAAGAPRHRWSYGPGTRDAACR
jgi:hypothetical protein